MNSVLENFTILQVCDEGGGKRVGEGRQKWEDSVRVGVSMRVECT